MQKLFYIAALFLIAFCGEMAAQSNYFVGFVDKSASDYQLSNPSAYLSPRAIARRTAHNIAIDSTDLPVNQRYIDSLKVRGASIVLVSRWMNGVTIVADSASRASIAELPFVTFMERTRYDAASPAPPRQQAPQNDAAYGPALNQAAMLGVPNLHNHGYRGQGKLITVVDNGFPGVEYMTLFDSIRSQIVDTYNFVNGNANPYVAGTHGTQVFSTIAAHIPNTMIGTAPKAQYALMVTEANGSESRRECDNWIAAAERADSIGTDIITTSLGYTWFDESATAYTYDKRDGTSRMSRAATLAARKGILVLTAAGNEGSSSDPYASVPADADSTITIGSVDAWGVRSSFSSIGPTYDGRIKPTLMAQGTAAYVAGAPASVYAGNGTSYATPILAGAAASLWSAFPNWSNMLLMERLIESATLYENPNDLMGYGIPNVTTILDQYLVTDFISQSDILSHFNLFYSANNRLLTIESFDTEMFTYTVYDVRGRKIVESQGQARAEYSLANETNGIFIVRISTSKGNDTRKIVKY